MLNHLLQSVKTTAHTRRVVFSSLQDKYAVTELFQEVSKKLVTVRWLYRIIKTGNRLGDNAAMCFIELVDYNENMLKENVAKKLLKHVVQEKATTAEATVAG